MTPLEGEGLIDALRQGGYVLYFRHAATDQSQTDTDTGNLENCAAQRNLTEQGRADARAIGEAFKTLNIPVGTVLSSRYCRTRETAQLAFGHVEAIEDLTGFPTNLSQERIAALRRLLSVPPLASTNTVLVAHGFNIQNTAQLSLVEGEAAIFAPSGSDYTLIARVKPNEWRALVALVPLLTPEAQAQVTPTMQSYTVPAGSHPHDVAPAPDGSVWYTAQGSGELGRLDPATGETHHIKLGTPSAPHGVIIGPDGAPWVTDSGLNAIVRVDPQTEEVKTYPLPDGSRNANLNTATFDKNGVLWFTGQTGVYGRLDPQKGATEVWDAPQGPGPYGIATTPSGDVFYASLAGSHIARLDLATAQATVIEPPTAGQGARRVWSDSQGRIWVSEYNAGNVGMYDPASQQWREWRLPGDSPHAYAVYVDDQDMVWLSDFGANAIVRFDPTREAFDSFALPSSPGNVRQLLGRPGEVWGAESAADKLVVIRTR